MAEEGKTQGTQAPESKGTTGQGTPNPEGTQQTEPQNQTKQNQAPASFDYDKLASIIQGKQTVTEDTVLKNFFKQQGLSREEASQAIAAFKAEREKKTPDIAALQSQAAQSQQLAQQAMVEKEATLEALTLGIDTKTIPYILKLADLSNVVGTDGKVNAEAVKTAINKVLEDVPQLKAGAKESNNGFQIGSTAAANTGTQPAGQQTQAAGPAKKRWNRFN